MIELNYSSSAQAIRVVFPESWDPALLTGLTLTIKDRQGAVLMAAAPATLWPDAVLDGAAPAFSLSIKLDGTPTALAPQDPIKIVGAGGISEYQTVADYNTVTKVATLESILRNGYSDGDDVYGLWAIITVDLSNTTTYPAGKELTLLWTPSGISGEFTELAEISRYNQLDAAGFAQYLRDIYPRAYDGLVQPRNRLSTVIEEATQKVAALLISRDPTFVLSKVRDQRLIRPAIAAACAVIWVRNADSELEDERKEWRRDLSEEIETLASQPVWVDLEDDFVEEAGETSEHPHVFRKGW
jgi:hypothetical protein